MEAQNIAIVGLGTVGETFLSGMLRLKDKGINVVGVVETADTPALQQASAAGVKSMSIEEVVAMGDAVDIIFDLTGDREVRRELRKTLFASNNQHTVIAPESVAQLVWSVLSDAPFPAAAGKKGY